VKKAGTHCYQIEYILIDYYLGGINKEGNTYEMDIVDI
jgi:hypothetical protein